MFLGCSAKIRPNLRSAAIRWRHWMDEVFKMYAMSDGDPLRESGGLDNDQVETFSDEEDELETAGILTSSDDDVIAEETVIVIAEPVAPKPAAKKAPAKKAAKKAPAKKAAKKAPAKKAAKKAPAKKAAKKK